MIQQDVVEVFKALDKLLGPGGFGMSTFIMNYPNLAKVRRVIGSDDDEINQLLLDKQGRASRLMSEQMERHHELWKTRIAYDRSKGSKLKGLVAKVFDIVKQGGHFTLQEILVQLSPGRVIAIGQISDLEKALHELERRGRITRSTNRINKKDDAPLVDVWYRVSADERKIFAGLTPSKAYFRKTPKLPVVHVNMKDVFDKSKMHKK
jgi:hypothetical protein